MHDYYLIRVKDDGSRSFWNHARKVWEPRMNDSLYTLAGAKRQVKRLQKETVFPVSILHFKEVK